ncbi:Uncharacterized protein AXF42_Ash015245 [Apostasia shenzhenica]|uniref:Uncharacterized protein n=1 Tax=Apostasia shenzhenica TaxID=1088818 RepID=A0A2I0ALN3_9ASPA|nr:Uncharacterized protein AXF42_Ash015245 [Apostasia shenzhenica]
MGDNAHGSMETVIAAANAVASAESRAQRITVRRRRWKALFRIPCCFRSYQQTNRISRSVLVPEPMTEGSDAPAPFNLIQTSGLLVAPPSSPASFLQSYPPSTTHSPAKFFSLSALAANSYSPTGSSSIFAIGPYADDTKLVSPPFFSSTTEPSTAPVTPPEPAIQTTPSSPEVPFAELLSSTFDANCKRSEAYDFQPYYFHPGSPISHLISPTSVCSGTSSPFPDMEFNSHGQDSVPSFPVAEPPKILSAEDLALRKLAHRQIARDNGSILEGRITAVRSTVNEGRIQNDESYNDDISFEFTALDARHKEKKSGFAKKVSPVSPGDLAQTINATNNANGISLEHSSELRASKEFNFNVEAETVDVRNWVLFPVCHPGVG